jgi:hypothetical protein
MTEYVAFAITLIIALTVANIIQAVIRSWLDGDWR